MNHPRYVARPRAMHEDVGLPGFRVIRVSDHETVNRADTLEEAEHLAAIADEADDRAGVPRCTTFTRFAGYGPSHNGSANCKSGSIASGGFRAHCSCDTCF